MEANQDAVDLHSHFQPCDIAHGGCYGILALGFVENDFGSGVSKKYRVKRTTFSSYFMKKKKS